MAKMLSTFPPLNRINYTPRNYKISSLHALKLCSTITQYKTFRLKHLIGQKANLLGHSIPFAVLSLYGQYVQDILPSFWKFKMFNIFKMCPFAHLMSASRFSGSVSANIKRYIYFCCLLMLRVKLVYDKIKAKWKENFMIMDAALCEDESEAYIYTFIHLARQSTVKTMEREFMAITWILYVQNLSFSAPQLQPLENVLTITDLLSLLVLLIKSKINLLEG